MTQRDEDLLRLALLTLAVERAISIPFWQAFDDEEKRVLGIQAEIKKELRDLANKLWPEQV